MFTERRLCARCWGPWDFRRGLLGEDLLVANTDFEYMTEYPRGESYRGRTLGLKAWWEPKTSLWGQRMSPRPPQLGVF